MAKDKTFDDKDIIRIICNNLTESERNNVIAALRSRTVCDKYEPDNCLTGSIEELEALRAEMVTVSNVIQLIEDILNNPAAVILTRNPLFAGIVAAIKQALELLREWLEESSAILDNIILDLWRCRNGS